MSVLSVLSVGPSACGKTPAAVTGGAPASASADASTAALASAAPASGPSGAAVASASPKRPAGCWSNTPWTEPKARLEALAVRCAKGFPPLVPSTTVKAGGSLDVVLPPNTCARVVIVGAKPKASLERTDGIVFARAEGEADAVLPEAGPFCTGKGETVKLHLATEGQAAVFASP